MTPTDAQRAALGLAWLAKLALGATQMRKASEAKGNHSCVVCKQDKDDINWICDKLTKDIGKTVTWCDDTGSVWLQRGSSRQQIEVTLKGNEPELIEWVSAVVPPPQVVPPAVEPAPPPGQRIEATMNTPWIVDDKTGQPMRGKCAVCKEGCLIKNDGSWLSNCCSGKLAPPDFNLPAPLGGFSPPAVQHVGGGVLGFLTSAVGQVLSNENVQMIARTGTQLAIGYVVNEIRRDPTVVARAIETLKSKVPLLQSVDRDDVKLLTHVTGEACSKLDRIEGKIEKLEAKVDEQAAANGGTK